MKIKLEKFSYEDIPELASWVPNKEFLLQWAGPSYTLDSLEDQLKHELDMMSESEPKYIMFSAKSVENNETVGHIQLLWIDKVNLSARIGRVLVGKNEYRSRGIGLEMVNAALDIAFNKLNLHRVDLGVFNFNLPAISCYKKAGFIVEGSLRECRKMNDEYWSLLNMSILENEYRNLINH